MNAPKSLKNTAVALAAATPALASAHAGPAHVHPIASELILLALASAAVLAGIHYLRNARRDSRSSTDKAGAHK